MPFEALELSIKFHKASSEANKSVGASNTPPMENLIDYFELLFFNAQDPYLMPRNDFLSFGYYSMVFVIKIAKSGHCISQIRHPMQLSPSSFSTG